jgi:5-methylcytosine-specific restriction endonuclease McrA
VIRPVNVYAVDRPGNMAAMPYPPRRRRRAGRWWMQRRALVLAAAGPTPRCGICGQTIWPLERRQVDHIVPLADGGSDALENLQVCHQRCNMATNGRRSAKLREQRLASGESERRIWEGAITLDDAQGDV